MKPLVLSILTAAILAVPASAEKKSVPVVRSPGTDDYVHNNPVGKRMPAAPIDCIIDFDAKTIEIGAIDHIKAYELYNEDGDTLIASFSYDVYMVEHLTSISGIYQLRIKTENLIYTGYIEL